MQAPVGLLDSRVQGLEALGTLVPPVGRGRVAVRPPERELRQWPAEQELERRSA